MAITRYRPGRIAARATGTDGALVSGPVTVHSRRRPWPYDLIVNGVPVILRPQENGLMIGKKVQSLQGVVPITYDYSSQPVYAERTFPFRRLTGGYGDRIQHAPASGAYYYATNADLSIGGLQIKGPLFHAVAPPSTGAVAFFIDAVDAGVTPPPGYPAGWPPLSTFAGAGQYVLRRTADTGAGWAVSKDFGAGHAPVKAVRFRAPGQADSLWVVTASGQLWRFDGTAWAMSTQPAFSLTVLRDELWVKDTANTVKVATADPMVAASFGAAITVGDASQPITNLEVLDDALYVFKTNGIFTIAPDTSARDRFPSFRSQPLPRNGVNAYPWLGRLWFGYGDGFYWMDNQGTLTPTGPNLLMENNSEVSGEVSCFTGHAAWFGYYGLWNKGPTLATAGVGDSYLLKHGTWLNPDDDPNEAYQFAEVVNGAVKKWTGKKVTALYVSDAAQGNARLYAGFSDGTVEWCLLPRGTANPTHPDSGCEFTTEESWVYWPLHHAMFQADAKSYRGFSVFGPRIDAQNTVRVQYRLVRRSVEAAPPAQQTPWQEVAPAFTHSGQRIDLQDDIFGYALEVRHALVSANQSSPVLEGLALHEMVRPSLLLEYTWTVNARAYLARRDGVIDRRTPWQIKESAMSWAATAGTVEVVLPDEGIQSLSIVDYSEALSPVTKRYGADWDVAMRAIQFKTLTVYGSWDRVAFYDWDTIGDYTWDDLLFL